MGYGIAKNGRSARPQVGGRSCRLSVVSCQLETTTGVATDDPKCQFIFTGRRFDPETSDATTQMYFYRARYYSPQLGRFISRDPIDYAGGMNLYEYVGSRPIGHVDPAGLQLIRNRLYNANSQTLHSIHADLIGNHGYTIPYDSFVKQVLNAQPSLNVTAVHTGLILWSTTPPARPTQPSKPPAA